MQAASIQKAGVNDLEKLRAIARQTFIQTFSEGNTVENMEKYLEEKFSVAKLTAELTDENAQFYFARIDGRVVGYLKLNAGGSQTELRDTNALEIERIYVLKDYHGNKVGQMLYEKAMEIANERRADYVWLGVWEENSRAIAFYQKNGFIEFDRHLFRLGDEEQTDIMMKKIV